MTAITILVISCVLGAFAQNPHSIPGFQYTGCSSIDISCFGNPVPLPDGCVTPEACQKACEGYQFAALLNEECRCGNDSRAVNPKDESMCDHACQNNANIGCCGNSLPLENPGIANVYEEEPQLQPYTAAPSAVATVASQSLSSAAPVNSQLNPPGYPAPGPQSQSSVLATSQPAPAQPSQYQTIGESQPCDGSQHGGVSPTADGYSTTEVSLPASESLAVDGCQTADGSQTVESYQTAEGYPTGDGQAPEPQTYQTSAVDAAEATESQSASALSNPQYGTTMATSDAPSNEAVGEAPAPAPSQLPGSDSSPIYLPSFSSIGSLVMVTMMMMM